MTKSTNPISNEELKLIEDTIGKDADAIKTDRAFGGYWDDGGAAEMVKRFELWKTGYLGKVPPEYAKILKDAKREADPEYAEFKRLKKKFCG